MRLHKTLAVAFLTAAISFHAFAEDAKSANGVPSTVHPLKAPGIENFYQLSDRFYSGSAPEGDAAFAALKARGVKTIITVDGSKPDIETAHKYGIKYVHLPIGYDGVPTNQANRLVKAAEIEPGPIFVHCHHGMHRGPAGAAVICMGVEGWTPGQADAWLKLAGTSTNYPGLYRSVDNFHVPSAELLQSLPSKYPEQTDVSPLAETMIQMDERFDHLKLIKKAGYKVPASNPDLNPVNEALQLNELLKELLRLPPDVKHPEDFHTKLTAAQQAAAALHNSLKTSPVDEKAADVSLQRVTDSCAACHKAYRN